MLVDKSDRTPSNLSRIDVSQEWEVTWWSAHLQTTPERLRSTVQKVGPSADDVRQELRQAAHEAFQNTGED